MLTLTQTLTQRCTGSVVAEAQTHTNIHTQKRTHLDAQRQQMEAPLFDDQIKQMLPIIMEAHQWHQGSSCASG